jgi:hypothetical protein
MAILVPRWLDFSRQVRMQMCLKFCMVKVANCMGSPSVQYNISPTFPRYQVLDLGSPRPDEAILSP